MKKLYEEKKAVQAAAQTRWKLDRERLMASGEWVPREKGECERKDKRSGGKNNNIRIYEELLIKQGFTIKEDKQGFVGIDLRGAGGSASGGGAGSARRR